MRIVTNCFILFCLAALLWSLPTAARASKCDFFWDLANVTGSISYGDGQPDDTNPINLYPALLGIYPTNQPPRTAGRVLCAWATTRNGPAISGHGLIECPFRVRFTATTANEQLPGQFSGTVCHSMYALASANYPNFGTATITPDGASPFTVSAPSQLFGNSYQKLQTAYVPKTISLSTSGTDANGNKYVEGTIKLSATFDLSGQFAGLQTVDGIDFLPAKQMAVTRAENSPTPLVDDGNALSGFLEHDVYNADGSAGTGHSRFRNYVSQVTYANMAGIVTTQHFGYTFSDEDWMPVLAGVPWPPPAAFYSNGLFGFASAQRQWQWNATPSGESSSSPFGTDPGPPGFTSNRPQHNYPWDSGPLGLYYIPLDMLDEMQNSKLPKPDKGQITLHVKDTDLTNNLHPEWNYDKTVTFDILFHNRYEEPTNLAGPMPTPLADNPWKKYHTPTVTVPGVSNSGGGNGGTVLGTIGIAPDPGHPGTGTDPWSPGQVSTYLETSASGSFNCSVFNFGVSGNLGYSSAQTVPSKYIPVNWTGVVYFQPEKNRTTFNYKHYLQGGRHIVGFNADGTEILHKGKVDRPTGVISYVVWVQLSGSDWPEATSLDLGNGGG